MPLFGSKHKHDHDIVNDTSGHVDHQHPYNAGAQGGIPSQGQNDHLNSGRPYEQPYQGAGPTGPFRQDNQFRQQDYRDPYGQPSQMGAGPGPAPGPNAGFPASSVGQGDPHHNGSTGGGVGGTAAKFTGKVESAIGSMIGSQSLIAKGLEKERQANTATTQGPHLSEPERLEREAFMRHQNVAGQGAYPTNAPASGAGQFSSGFGPAGVQPGGGMSGGYPQ